MNRSEWHKAASKPVTIRGVEYVSAWHAAKEMGCTPQNIQRARKEGRLDQVRNRKCQTSRT